MTQDKHIAARETSERDRAAVQWDFPAVQWDFPDIPDFFAQDAPRTRPILPEQPQVEEEPEEDQDGFLRSAVSKVWDLFTEPGELTAGGAISGFQAQRELGMTPIPILGQLRGIYDPRVREKQAEILGTKPLSFMETLPVVGPLVGRTNVKDFNRAAIEYEQERESLFWGEKLLTEMALDPLNALFIFGKPIKAAQAAKLGSKGILSKRISEGIHSDTVPFRNMRDLIDEVEVSSNPFTRFLVGKSGINPSILRNSLVGKMFIGFNRQKIASDELRDLVVSSTFDKHAKGMVDRFGHILPIDNDGFIQGTGKLWNDVFSRPDDFVISANGTPLRALIDDVHDLIDTMNRWRENAGLKPFKKLTREGNWFWIPRQVTTIEGVVLQKPSNPKLQRLWEEASEGFAKGVRYNTDPRATIDIYVRQTLREIMEKEFDDIVKENLASITPKMLIPRRIVELRDNAAEALKRAKREVSSIHIPLVDAKKQRALINISRGYDEALRRAAQAGIPIVITRTMKTKLKKTLNPKTDKTFTDADIKTMKPEEVFDTLYPPQAVPPIAAPVAMSKAAFNSASLTKKEMIARGADGNLNRAIETEVPISRIEGLEPIPSMEGGYVPGRRITQPVEIKYENGQFILYSGNHRVQQAIANGDSKIRAFVEGSYEDLSGILPPSTAAPVPRGKAALLGGRRQLEALIKERQVTRQTLITRRAAANRAEKIAQGEWQRAEIAYRRAMESAKAASVAPAHLFSFGDAQAGGKIGIKQWHNRFFPEEIAKELENGMAEIINPAELDVFSKGIRTVGDSVRVLSAGADMAMPFIQGLPMLARNPLRWAEMTKKHYQAFFDPQVLAREFREHEKTYVKMARNGISIGDPEMYAALRQGQLPSLDAMWGKLPKGAEVRSLLSKGGKQTWGRFQSSYNTGLATMRRLTWEALEPNWKGTESQLAQYIRNLSGALDSRALGVSPKRSALEGMYLAFSPRLLRSTIGLFAMAAKPGTPQGKEALRTLGQLMGGAVGFYVVSGLALGKSWEEIGTGLTPTEGKKFLSHEINGDWIGVGGQVRAIMQAMSHAYSSLAPGGQPIQNLYSLNQYDNPIIAMWQSRGAPALGLTQATAEAVFGADVLPFDKVDNVPDLIKHVGTSALPFSIQGMAEGEDVLATAFGFTGMRTSAQTPGESRNETRGLAMIRLGYSGKYDDQDQIVKNHINSQPEVVAAQEEVDERGRDRGTGWQEYKDKRNAINEAYRNRIIGASRELSLPEFRKLYGKIKAEKAMEKSNLQKNYAEDLEFLNELPPSKHPVDLAIDAYYNSVMDPSLEDPITGEYDFKERKLREEEFEDRYGRAMHNKIQGYIHQNETLVEQELRRVRDELEPYWEVRDDYLDRHPNARRIEEIIDRNKRPGGNLSIAMRYSKHPSYKAYLSYVRKRRELLRQRFPAFKKYLIAWYGGTPKSARDLRQAQIYMDVVRRLIDTPRMNIPPGVEEQAG